MKLKSGKFVMVSGYVPKDAETKVVGQNDTPCTKFGVKADETVDEDTNERVASWANCTAWGDLARKCANIHKGDHVFATGTLRTFTYTDRDGNEKDGSEIVIDFVAIAPSLFVPPAMIPGINHKEKKPAVPAEDFEDITDDDLPF